MSQDKTAGNQVNTSSIGVELQLETIAARIDHIDIVAHGIDQKLTAIAAFLEEHKPLLDRYARLAGAGSAVRAAMGMGRK